MSLILAAALVASTAVLPTCSWDKPGQNPFMGDVVAAVDRYTDIPKSARDTLKKRMAKRQYDDIAEIKRDTIQGKKSYADLREMHFGPGTICKTITRKAWTDKSVERGLVYCENGHCLIVPTVCRNVSRISLKPQEEPLEFETAAGPVKSDPPVQPVDNSPLDFETAAGPQTVAPPAISVTPTPVSNISFPTWTPPSLYIPYVPAIPEPPTTLLMLIGLVTLHGLKQALKIKCS